MAFVTIPIIDYGLFAVDRESLMAAETVASVITAAEILLGVCPCLKRGEPW